jgi:hypothetical protein
VRKGHEEAFGAWVREHAPWWIGHGTESSPYKMAYGWPAQDEGASRWLFWDDPSEAVSSFSELYLSDAGVGAMTADAIGAMSDGDKAFAKMLFDQENVYIWDANGWRMKTDADGPSWIVEVDQAYAGANRIVGNALATIGDAADWFDREIAIPLQAGFAGHPITRAGAGGTRFGLRSIALLQAARTVRRFAGAGSRAGRVLQGLAASSKTRAVDFLRRADVFHTEFHASLRRTHGSLGGDAFQAAFNAAKRAFSRAPGASGSGSLRSWVSSNEMSFWTGQSRISADEVDGFVDMLRKDEFDWSLLGGTTDPAIIYKHGGRYIVNEGHHRFAAVLRYADEIGNPGLIDKFLQNAVIREGLPGRTSVDSLVGLGEILP